MAVFTLALFLLIVSGVRAQIDPVNAAVLLGSRAQFTCSSPQPVSAMTWMLNEHFVLGILESVGVINSSDRFSATNLSSPGNYKWEFAISGVQRADAGEVACQLMGGVAQVATLSVQEQGSVQIVGGNQTVTQGVQTEFMCQAAGWFPEPNMSWSVNGVGYACNRSSQMQGSVFNSSCSLSLSAVSNASVQCLVSIPALSSPDTTTVFLTVQKLTKRDYTVLIAVTVAFSAAALLFLIIYGIVFFCRRRKKKSSYQEEVRRVQSQNRTPGTEELQGWDNRGFITDGRANRGVWYTNQSKKIQMTDSFFEDQRKHRHMTIV